jgi:hypothetical protein
MSVSGESVKKARVALVLKGDPSQPGSWSGVPASLASGLRSIGCEVVPVDAEIPRGGRIAKTLGIDWAEMAASRAFAAASGFVTGRRLGAAGALDGIVMMGSGYLLDGRAPFVTFDDMTVAQAIRQGGPEYQVLSESAAARWQARQKRAYRDARGCCAASNWAAESIRGEYGIPGSKVHVVGFGHNVEMEKPKRDWEVPRFLWVGVDWERKRGAAVVEAFGRLRELHPRATLDLVGAHPEVDADGVTGHGRLALGSEQGQREYADLLRRSTCFVMPSTYEPLGIAYIDAATAGMAAIGTTSGGAADAVGDGGTVVDPFDSEALLAAMLELCDPETASRLGDRARAHSDLYTWRAVAERVLRALAPAGVEADALAPFIGSSTAGRDG